MNFDKRDNFDYSEILGNGKKSTGKRVFAELEKRFLNLTNKQINLFKQTDLQTKKQILFLAACKTYTFIKEFMNEVVFEKVRMGDSRLTHGDYLNFWRYKQEIHDNMNNLSDLTISKIRQVTFKIFEEAGIIDNVKSKEIQNQFLIEDLQKVIIEDNPQYLKTLLHLS